MKRMLISATVTPRFAASTHKKDAQLPTPKENAAPAQRTADRRKEAFAAPTPISKPSPIVQEKTADTQEYPPAMQARTVAQARSCEASDVSEALETPRRFAVSAPHAAFFDAPHLRIPAFDDLGENAFLPKRPDADVFFRFAPMETLYLFVTSQPSRPPQPRMQSIEPTRTYHALQSVHAQQQEILSRLLPTQ